MKIVYLQEWGERIDDAKHKILNKFGDDVWCPKINYMVEKNIIYNYSNEIKHFETPTLIIGSFLGGYMAYHVSNIVRYPSLLFNPTFFYKSGGEVRRDGMEEHPEKTIVFSMKNEDIDIKRTVKFLDEYGHKDIKFYEGISQIPLDIFENEFIEFREKYKSIKGTGGNKRRSSLDYKLEVKKNRFAPVGEPDILDEPIMGVPMDAVERIEDWRIQPEERRPQQGFANRVGQG